MPARPSLLGKKTTSLTTAKECEIGKEGGHSDNEHDSED
jgi:hypothetical protein